MKIVGATEQAVVLSRSGEEADTVLVDGMEFATVLYRDKLPKFNNGRQTDEDGKNNPRNREDDFLIGFCGLRTERTYQKIHPTQKPVNLLKTLIEVFTDEGDVVIDPCAGSGTTLRAAAELNRNSYGFEIVKDFYNLAKEQMLAYETADKTQTSLF